MFCAHLFLLLDLIVFLTISEKTNLIVVCKYQGKPVLNIRLFSHMYYFQDHPLNKLSTDKFSAILGSFKPSIKQAVQWV